MTGVIEEKPRRPPVIDGVLQYTSVSAMQKLDSCDRQWRYRYVEGLPDKPMGKGAKRGEEGHKRIEIYEKGGPNILDPLELKGLEAGLILPPGPDLLIEEKLHGLIAEGVPLTGKIDMVSQRTPGLLQITDWKFKKSIKKYGTRGVDLTDPNHEAGIQMLGYAAWAVAQRARFAPFDHIELRHVTFQTEGASKVEPSVAVADLTYIGEQWETVSHRILPRMKSAARAPSPNEVPRNLSSCEKYGGCPYRGVCLDAAASIASALRQRSPTKEHNVSMLDQLMPSFKPNGAAPMAVTPPAPAVQVTAPAPTRALIQDDGQNPTILASSAAAGTQYRVPGADGSAVLATLLAHSGAQSFFLPVAGGAPITIAATAQILPGHAAPPPPPVVVAPPVVAVAVAPPPAQPIQMQSAQAPAPVAAPAEPKRGRGRPRKEVTTAAAQPGTTAGFDGVYLYFGCAPVGVATSSLADHVEDLEAQFKAAAKLEIIDLRVCSDNPYGFGKWKGFLAKLAQEVPLDPGYYVVTRGDERLETVAEAIAQVIASTGRVVMGAR